MLDRAPLSELIADIYEASYQPSLWPTVIEKLVRITHSRSGALLIHDKKVEEANGFYASGLSADVVEAYARLGHLDPGFKIMADVPIGMAINMYGPRRHEVESTDYYENIRKKHDIGYVCGANIVINEERHVGLGLQRSASDTAYSQETLELISEIIPHLQRGLRIHREFIRLRVEKTAATAGLDNLMMGLVLFDQLGTAVYLNPLAESILATHPAVSLANDRIIPTDREDATQLHRLITACLAPARQAECKRGGMMGLRHEDRKHPLALMVRPLATSDLANIIDGELIYAAMYINDPERPLAIDAETVSTLYKLSRTEANIAIFLANGQSVEEIAALQNRSIHTVRSHLKSLYHKTRTSNQTGLVRLILSGAAALPSSRD